MLIWGGSGGLGSQAIQIARAKGAIPVAVTSGDRARRVLRGTRRPRLHRPAPVLTLGGHTGLARRRRVREPGRRARAHSARRCGTCSASGAIRASCSSIPARSTIPTSMFVCDNGGMVVICAGTTGYHAAVDLRYLWMRQKRLQGSHFANDEQCAALNDMVTPGRGRPVSVADVPVRRGRGSPISSCTKTLTRWATWRSWSAPETPISATGLTPATRGKFPGAAAFESTGREGTGPGVAGNGAPGRFPDSGLWQAAQVVGFERANSRQPFGSTGKRGFEQRHQPRRRQRRDLDAAPAGQPRDLVVVEQRTQLSRQACRGALEHLVVGPSTSDGPESRVLDAMPASRIGHGARIPEAMRRGARSPFRRRCGRCLRRGHDRGRAKRRLSRGSSPPGSPSLACRR